MARAMFSVVASACMLGTGMMTPPLAMMMMNDMQCTTTRSSYFCSLMTASARVSLLGTICRLTFPLGLGLLLARARVLAPSVLLDLARLEHLSLLLDSIVDTGGEMTALGNGPHMLLA